MLIVLFLGDFNLLDKESHERHCQILEAAQRRSERLNISKTYGINRRSSMLDFPDFDLTKCIPMDIMHIMQEGVIEYEIKCVLKVFVEEKVINLNDFNQAMDTYFEQFRKDTVDRPHHILNATLRSIDNKLKQGSATIMLNLAKAMPFILNGLVRDPSTISQDRLKLLSEVLEISHFMFSPVVAADRLDVMSNLIERHLQLFTRLFPDCRIIPKQHYMLHIPRNIAMFGPAFRFSTARFESYHRPHKRHIIHQQNYINPAFSIVECCQYDDSVAAESPRGKHPIFKFDLVTGKVKALPLEKEAATRRQLKETYNEIEDDCSIKTTKFVTVCGQKYFTGYTFVAVEVHDDDFLFGKVNNILLIEEKKRPDFTQVVLELTMYRTIGLNKKFQAYKVEKDPLHIHTQFFIVEDLLDHSGYEMCNHRGSQYIPLMFEVNGLVKLYKDGHKGIHNQLHRRGRYID